MDELTKGLIFLAGVAIGTIIYRLYKEWRYPKVEIQILPAQGQYLDRTGEQWGVQRKQGECDRDYRERLLAAMKRLASRKNVWR